MGAKERSGLDEAIANVALTATFGVMVLTYVVDSWGPVRETSLFFWGFVLAGLGSIASHAVTSKASRPWMAPFRNVLLIGGFVLFVAAAVTVASS